MSFTSPQGGTAVPRKKEQPALQMLTSLMTSFPPPFEVGQKSLLKRNSNKEAEVQPFLMKGMSRNLFGKQFKEEAKSWQVQNSKVHSSIQCLKSELNQKALLQKNRTEASAKHEIQNINAPQFIKAQITKFNSNVQEQKIGFRKSSMQQAMYCQQNHSSQSIHKPSSQSRGASKIKAAATPNIFAALENPRSSRNLGVTKTNSYQNCTAKKKQLEILTQLCQNEKNIQISMHSQKGPGSNLLGSHISMQSHATLCETGGSVDNNSTIHKEQVCPLLFNQENRNTQNVVAHKERAAEKQQTTTTTGKSSVISEGAANVGAESLMEGKVGVILPTSKINLVGLKMPSRLTEKNTGDEGENIIFSEDEQSFCCGPVRDDPKSCSKGGLKDTLLEKSDQYSSPEGKGALHSTSKKSPESDSSFDEDNGITPLLEQFCKRGDLANLSQFSSIIRGELQRLLVHRAIEYRHLDILKFILTRTAPIRENCHLLHIACRSQTTFFDKETDRKKLVDLEIVKLIMQFDKFADLNDQDTYGNTPVHLAAQNSKVGVLKYFLEEHQPMIYIKNCMGKSAVNTSKNPEVVKVFAKYLEKHKSQDGYRSCLAEKRLQTTKRKQKKLVKTSSDKRLDPQDFSCQKPLQLSQLSSSIKEASLTDQQFSSKDKQQFRKVYLETDTSSKDRFHSRLIDSSKGKLFIEEEEDCESDFSPTDKNFQICSQIEEVSEESFHHSLLSTSAKVGPHQFSPVGLLGKGSFGEVYLVRKHDSRQLYAMKVLQKERIMGQNLVKYAITERNVLSYTRHPFIVGLNYAFQTKNKLFLILDYCPGGDLGKLIQREKRLSEERARTYLAEVVLALEDLHKRDIIFRDLKPDNVVLDAEGHALLTDFGLSKEGVLDNYGAKSFCGSVAYLAPEMIRKTGHGKSVDWYLLGVLLYEMLVGIPPYFSNDKQQLFQNIEKGPLLIPQQLSFEAKNLLIGLMNKNPMKRLGAGERDAEEIKEHAFFRGVKWGAVLEKKLRAQKPDPCCVKALSDRQSQEYADLVKEIETEAANDDENRLPGWSFVTPKLQQVVGQRK